MIIFWLKVATHRSYISVAAFFTRNPNQFATTIIGCDVHYEVMCAKLMKINAFVRDLKDIEYWAALTRECNV